MPPIFPDPCLLQGCTAGRIGHHQQRPNRRAAARAAQGGAEKPVSSQCPEEVGIWWGLHKKAWAKGGMQTSALQADQRG